MAKLLELITIPQIDSMLLRHCTIELLGCVLSGLDETSSTNVSVRDENSAIAVNGLLIFFFVVFSSDSKDGETETKGERNKCFLVVFLFFSFF